MPLVDNRPEASQPDTVINRLDLIQSQIRQLQVQMAEIWFRITGDCPAPKDEKPSTGHANGIGTQTYEIRDRLSELLEVGNKILKIL